MIQDMFDPEFYMGVYETVNQNTKARVCIAFLVKLSACNFVLNVDIIVVFCFG